MLYFADADWWEWHRDRPEFKAFQGAKATISPSGDRVTDPDVLLLRNAGAEGLSLEPNALFTGYSSGFQALNFALLAGAKRIVLLGYDMKPGGGGRNNWHQDHRRGTPDGQYAAFRRPFKVLPPLLVKLGVEVLNATPASALQIFPRAEIESLLPDSQPAALSA